MEEKEARDQLEAALTQRFEEAFPAFIEAFKANRSGARMSGAPRR